MGEKDNPSAISLMFHLLLLFPGSPSGLLAFCESSYFYCILQNTWELFSPSWVPWECSAWSTFPPGERNEVWWAPHHGKLPPPLGPLRASLPLLLGSCDIWGSIELLLWIYTRIICCKMPHIQFISLFSSKLPTREREELIRMQVQPAGLS